MKTGVTEFSRRVPLGRIGADGFCQEIAASAAEREALARRFGLVSLERLSASVELLRRAGGLVLLRAAYRADFAQNCVVTLDPVPGTLDEEFSLLYGPPEAEDAAIAAEEDFAFEPLPGDAIDIGEAVAQEFSLALPPFPRTAEAILEAEMPPEPAADTDADPGPFAGLTRLIGRRED